MDNVGDFILWLDGARAIRRAYPRPENSLTLIASEALQEFAATSGLFDDIIAVDRRRIFEDASYRRRMLKLIAARHFETAINPTYSRNAWTDDLVVRATGAAERIGHRGDLANARQLAKWVADRWYTRQIAVDGRGKHELVRNWEFGRYFDPQLALRYPVLEPSMIERPAWLEAEYPDYFVLFPGSAWPIKRWPVDRFAELARRIHQRTGWRALVCGAQAELGTAQLLIERASTVPIENVCGRTQLGELAGIIAEARFVVTNDSMAIHLARALKRPAVPILGGGQFGRFLPYPELQQPNVRTGSCAYQPMLCYQCDWHCIYNPAEDEPGPCIAAVSVDQAWACVEPMLAA
jgi:ADP-heptose:LPS heptosyltransferase